MRPVDRSLDPYRWLDMRMPRLNFLQVIAVLCLVGPVGLTGPRGLGQETSPVQTLNRQAEGYRGIWYMNQPSGDEYVYKYSGGLGTYCAKHKPFAVYCREVDKTFFCYGGAAPGNNRRLLHMVSFYDHRTGTVPRPTILLDKQTGDAHDNPVLSVDDQGFIWVFSTSHGRSRPSFIHRSRTPYDVSEFERIQATRLAGSKRIPITNFSYMQVWNVPGRGFAAFLTRYDAPAKRTLYFMSSIDGENWNPWQRLAQVEEGHYQVSGFGHGKIGTMFNFHPQGKGLNWRTNLYYVESSDMGKTWQTVDGRKVTLPVKSARHETRVMNYQEQNLNVYLKDLRYDHLGRPILLYVTSRGYQAGPENGPRSWMIAYWTGTNWRFSKITESDNNYDMGSLWIDNENDWCVVAPTEPGPQPYNPGGEIAIWTSRDRGKSWNKTRTLTRNSNYNHTYVRRPLNAEPDFYALWADGHGREPSDSRLYFCDQSGRVRMLPPAMQADHSSPPVIRSR